MRARLRCVWRRLWFSSVYGSCLGEETHTDAFDAMLRVLKFRLNSQTTEIDGSAGARGRASAPDVEACMAQVDASYPV